MAPAVLAASDLFIVDDDEMMRDALSIVFTLAGYRVTGFVDAQSFLMATRDRTPVCVLLDLHLPDKSGAAVLKELDAYSYPAPIFIVTGDDDVESAVDAVKKGCVRLPGQAARRSVHRHAGGRGHRLLP
jgi:two-component system response regulator FixJ